MKQSLRVAGLVLMMALALTGSVIAQEMPVFCGDLSDADCAFLHDSQVAALAVESTHFEMEADMTISNIPEFPVDSLNFHLAGEGAVAADAAPFLAMMMGSTDVETADFFTALADFMRTVSADMSLTLDVPAELAMLAPPDVELPEQVTVDVLMVDGINYINLDDLAAVAPEGSVPPGWVGMDVATFYGEVLSKQMAMTDFDIMEMAQVFMDEENLSSFMQFERLDDVEVDGQTMAVFHMTLDYSSLLDIPEFYDLIVGQMEMMGAPEDEMDEALAILELVYDGMTFEMEQQIGLDDMLTHNTAWTFDWDMAFIAEFTDIEADNAPHFTFSMNVAATGFNEPFEVAAPEDAMLLPLEMMMPPAPPQ
jgi:hypothetical protein